MKVATSATPVLFFLAGAASCLKILLRMCFAVFNTVWISTETVLSAPESHLEQCSVYSKSWGAPCGLGLLCCFQGFYNHDFFFLLQKLIISTFYLVIMTFYLIIMTYPQGLGFCFFCFLKTQAKFSSYFFSFTVGNGLQYLRRLNWTKFPFGNSTRWLKPCSHWKQ